MGGKLEEIHQAIAVEIEVVRSVADTVVSPEVSEAPALEPGAGTSAERDVKGVFIRVVAGKVQHRRDLNAPRRGHRSKGDVEGRTRAGSESRRQWAGSDGVFRGEGAVDGRPEERELADAGIADGESAGAGLASDNNSEKHHAPIADDIALGLLDHDLRRPDRAAEDVGRAGRIRERVIPGSADDNSAARDVDVESKLVPGIGCRIGEHHRDRGRRATEVEDVGQTRLAHAPVAVRTDCRLHSRDGHRASEFIESARTGARQGEDRHEWRRPAEIEDVCRAAIGRARVIAIRSYHHAIAGERHGYSEVVK